MNDEDTRPENEQVAFAALLVSSLLVLWFIRNGIRNI
jgi:hypothetical protein